MPTRFDAGSRWIGNSGCAGATAPHVGTCAACCLSSIAGASQRVGSSRRPTSMRRNGCRRHTNHAWPARRICATSRRARAARRTSSSRPSRTSSVRRSHPSWAGRPCSAEVPPAKLLEDVFDVARAVAGKLSIERRPFDVHQVVSDAVDGMQPEAEAEGITLEASLAPGSGELVGDPDRLRQVVWNLLANAVKFTPRGGRVTVHVWREGSEIAIEVSDTGIGVAPDLLPHVFDRFRQGDPGTKGRGGLGLGLAIARDLVELHGGVVRASSAGRGKGATFTVRLPAGASPARAPAGPSFARNGSSLEARDQATYTNV